MSTFSALAGPCCRTTAARTQHQAAHLATPGLQSPTRLSRRLARQVAASSSSGGNSGAPPPEAQQQAAAQSSIADNDAVFLAKLLGTSFALGAAIKYGSLLLPLPFEPNAAAAAALVLGPPLIWSAIKLTQSQQD